MLGENQTGTIQTEDLPKTRIEEETTIGEVTHSMAGHDPNGTGTGTEKGNGTNTIARETNGETNATMRTPHVKIDTMPNVRRNESNA